MKQIQFLQPSIQAHRPITQGHILGFVHQGKTDHDRGIICYPEQTYGISEESPDQFKLRHTLASKNGYCYRHQHKPQFKYYSQQRYFSVDGSIDPQLSRSIHCQDTQNKMKFHRKKGRLSEFMDKNGWMNTSTKIMGFERDDRARQLSNRQRSLKISNLPIKNKYINTSALKPNTSNEYFRTLVTFTSQKMRIRSKRNDEAQRFSQLVQSSQPRQVKSISFKNDSLIDRQHVQNTMLRTTRDWSPSKTTREIYEQSSAKMNSNRLLKNFNAKIDKRIVQRNSQKELHHENLQNWFRTTCSSKWVYNAKKQTENDEEQL